MPITGIFSIIGGTRDLSGAPTELSRLANFSTGAPDRSFHRILRRYDYGIKNPFLSGIRCFGVDWSELYHAGEDWFRIGENGGNIPIPGTEVTAVADGTVIWAQAINYPGRVVIISHTDSLLPQTTYSVYSHLDPMTLAVQAGQTVTRGQKLGTVLYQTDNNSHLHWEIRYFSDGSNIYPNYPNCNGFVPGRGTPTLNTRTTSPPRPPAIPIL